MTKAKAIGITPKDNLLIYTFDKEEIRKLRQKAALIDYLEMYNSAIVKLVDDLKTLMGDD